MSVRILLVDDQTIVRMGLRALLKHNPEFDIVGDASNGAEAIAAARALKPDLVMMDVYMPVMDGVDATFRLRAEFPDIRVIAVTACADKACMDRMIAVGAAGFLPKDCSGEELIQAIHRVFEGRVYCRTESVAVLDP